MDAPHHLQRNRSRNILLSGHELMMPQRAYEAAKLIDPIFSDTVWTDYNMFLSKPRLEVASSLGMRYFIMPKGYNPNDSEKDVPNHPTFTRLAYKDGLGLWE